MWVFLYVGLGTALIESVGLALLIWKRGFVVLSFVIVLSIFSQALVDAPDMVRSQMNFKRLSLTDIKIDIKRVPKKKELLAAMEAAGKFS